MSAADPRAWARAEARKLERYAAGDVGRFAAAARDVLLPGVPVAAILGFFANGGVDENTTGWVSCSARERAEALAKGRKPLGGDPTKGYGRVDGHDLNELGPGGVEGSHVPDEVATGDCPWAVLARSEGVRKVMGRDGVTGAAWHGAVEDQCVIGVANLARHGHLVRAKLDPRLQWDEDGDGGPKAWGLWPFFCAVSGWSAGDGGIDRHLDRFADELAALPPSHRAGAFLRLAGAVDDPGNRHAQDEYTGLRWSQKREAMVAAIPHTNEGAWATAWLDDGLGTDRDAVYAALVRAST